MRHAQLPRLDGSRVLVVDGHCDTLELNELALASLGADVRSAGSGEAALDVLREWWPNALLTDLRLPGMSAFELVEKLAARMGVGPLLAVATSADARPSIRENAMKLKFTASNMSSMHINSRITFLRLMKMPATLKENRIAASTR